MNYLEELAYWYFRLNGFLLITDFVNHKDNDLSHTHDTDFLGIRLPNIHESVGGNAIDFDSRSSTTKKICIIGEAKSGRYMVDEIFHNKNILLKAVMRLGCVPFDTAKIIVENLTTNSCWENDEYIIIKVLVAVRIQPSSRYVSISKDEIIAFIQNRKVLYRKHQDRLFFPSLLMQYLFSD